MEELNTLRNQVSKASFRVLFTDQHRVPPGVLLLSPTIDLNVQESLRRLIADTPSQMASEVGLVPTGTLPDYKYMISVVERVNSIFPAEQLKDGTSLLTQKPVRLFQERVASPQ